MQRVLTRDRSYYRSLILLALPVAAQNLIAFLASFADNLMVSSLGDVAVSGVYFGSQINVLVQMFTSGIGSVILILSAQYWGKDDRNSVKNIISIGMRLAIIVGAITTAICLLFPYQVIGMFTKDAQVIEQAVTYLRIVSISYIFFCVTQALLFAMRAVETASIGTAISLLSLLINITFNYIFIFRLGWGVFGAALATSIGRIAEALAMVIYVFFHDDKLKLKFADMLRFSRSFLRDYLKYGIPLISGELVWSVNLMANSIIFGRFFEAHVATAVSVTNIMATLAFIIVQGMASAVGIITGKTVGRGDYELMKEYARTTQVIFIILGLLNGLTVFLIRAPFLHLYTGAIGQGISPQAAEEAMKLMLVLSITTIGSSYQMPCLFGLVKSGGDISFVFKNDSFFVFLVVLPAGFLSAWLGAPAWVVFLCLKLDQILKSFVAVVKVNKFNWMKNLTRPAEEAAVG